MGQNLHIVDNEGDNNTVGMNLEIQAEETAIGGISATTHPVTTSRYQRREHKAPARYRGLCTNKLL